jgi:hypothetical protein
MEVEHKWQEQCPAQENGKSKTKDSDESEDDDAELRFLVALKLSPASTNLLHDNECVQDHRKRD